MSLLPWLLDAAYAGGLLAASPWLLYRMASRERFRAGFAQRLGSLPGALQSAPVWIHGASVGETLLSARLAGAVEQALGLRSAVSVNTNTGYRIACARVGPENAFYCPIDFHWIVHRVLRRLQPKCIVMVELEFWPNLWMAADRAGVPVVLANGRITERGHRRLARFGALCRRVFSRGAKNLYCVQNPTYADRLRSLGAPAERVRITGNMKFDTAEVAGVASRDAAAARLGLAAGEVVWTCGSTREGEEKVLLQAFAEVKARVGKARLVLAPRDPGRGDAVARAVASAGRGCARRSRDETAAAGDVYLLDTVGELAQFYAVADCVFVGGSLIPHGGHNVVEPAAAGKPVLFGPHTANFLEEAEILESCGAGRRVSTPAEIAEAAAELLGSEEARAAMGRAALRAVEENRGAVRKTLAAVGEAMGGSVE